MRRGGIRSLLRQSVAGVVTDRGMSAAMLNVHVRVNDGATGKSTPVRLRITDAHGVYRPPLGRLGDFPAAPDVDIGDHLRIGDDDYAYIDGTCEVPLPARPDSR